MHIIYTCISRQKLRSPAKGLLLVSYIKNLTKFKGEKRNKGLPKKFQDTHTYINISHLNWCRTCWWHCIFCSFARYISTLMIILPANYVDHSRANILRNDGLYPNWLLYLKPIFRLITTLLGTNIYPTVWHFWVDDASRFPMWDVSFFLEILSLFGLLELGQLLRRSSHLHPSSLTWNLKITCLKRNVIFQTFIFGFHVNLQRCSKWWLRSPPLRSHEGNGHGYEWTDLWGTKTKPRCCWSPHPHADSNRNVKQTNTHWNHFINQHVYHYRKIVVPQNGWWK